MNKNIREQCEDLIEHDIQNYCDGQLEKSDILDLVKNHGVSGADARTLWADVTFQILKDELD